MKLLLSWLKDFVDIDVEPRELSDKLLNIGFEVEEVIYTGENIEKPIKKVRRKSSKKNNKKEE